MPAFTDLKLHDICAGPDDPNREPLDMQHASGSPAFFAGNRKFLTRKLWRAGNEPPYFHHGGFTTLRQLHLTPELPELATAYRIASVTSLLILPI